MLGKLFKHNIKEVSKLMILIHIALLAFSFVGRILFYLASSKFDSNSPLNLFTAMYFFAYVMILFAVAILTYIYMARDFMKSMFSDEGYLMHTLPVTANQHIWSRFMTFALWGIIDAIVLILSLMIIFLNSQTMQYAPEFFSSFWNSFMNALSPSWVLSTIITVLNLIIGAAAGILMVYFCICIGSLCKTHKVLGAVGTFIGIYFILQIISTIFLFTTGWGGSFGMSTITISSAHNSLSTVYSVVSIAAELILAIGYYLGTRYILSKKLNLS